MTIPQFKFEHGTLQQALDQGYDVVQLKHAGEPVHVFISQGEMKVYSASSIRDLIYTRPVSNKVMAALVGTYSSQVSESCIIHDCLGTEFEGEYYRLDHAPYTDRYAIARSVVKQVLGLTLVQNFPISFTEKLWERVDKEGARGLVFRKKSDPPSGVVILQRYYPDLVQHLK